MRTILGKNSCFNGSSLQWRKFSLNDVMALITKGELDPFSIAFIIASSPILFSINAVDVMRTGTNFETSMKYHHVSSTTIYYSWCL